MKEKCTDTYEKLKQARRDQLIQICLKNGMLVAGNEDEDTLEMYIDMAYDDDFDGFGRNDDDWDESRRSNVDSETIKTRRIRR